MQKYNRAFNFLLIVKQIKTCLLLIVKQIKTCGLNFLYVALRGHMETIRLLGLA